MNSTLQTERLTVWQKLLALLLAPLALTALWMGFLPEDSSHGHMREQWENWIWIGVLFYGLVLGTLYLGIRLGVL